jgi:hypothetical protein
MRYGITLRQTVQEAPKDAYIFWLCFDQSNLEQRWFPTQDAALAALATYMDSEGMDEGYCGEDFVVVKIPDHLVQGNYFPANVDTTPNGRVCYDPLGVLTAKKKGPKVKAIHADPHDQGLF